MIVRLLILCALLLPACAFAQPTAEAQKVCAGAGLSGLDYEKYQGTEWPEERRRINADVPNVARRGDRLRLVIDGGESIELRDCLSGDGSYGYLYERFDDPGRFYVVRTPAYEDFYYTLVMKKTGRLFVVHGTPVWSSDKSRFLTVGCSALPPRGTLTIYTPSGDGLATEAEIELPCATESCSARWDFQSWISIACTPHDDTSCKGKEFVLMRGNDGTWNRFGR